MSHSPSPAAAAAAEVGAKHPDDLQQLQQQQRHHQGGEEAGEVFLDAKEEHHGGGGGGGGGGGAGGTEEEKEGASAPADEPAAATSIMGKLHLREEEEDEIEEEEDADHDAYDESHTPVGMGAGGLISPSAAAAAHAHATGDPALANTLVGVCDVCELEECACGKVAVRRGLFFEGSPAETKRGGKPHVPHKPHRAIEPTSWRPANKADYRSHHRPPHRDPRHVSVASRDADFVGDVPHGEHGTRSSKKAGEEAASSSSSSPPAAKAAPISAIDAEVQPPVVPPPGLKGRPSHTGGDRLPSLEVAHDPFERKGAPSSAAGAGGRGHVAGHKHRGQRHQDFTTLG